MSRPSQLTGLPVVSTCASAVLALRVLEVQRVALIGAPWFDPELNELGASYFASQAFEVVSSASAELSQDPAAIQPDAVYEWTAQHVDEVAEAVFIGGNGFRVVQALDALETAIERPVLSSNQVLLWHLLARVENNFQVNAFGQLLAHRP